MSTRATRQYLGTIRRNKHGCLNLISNDRIDECSEVGAGKTPKTLPPAMIVSRAEFVRSRVYPSHDQVLHDYRVHYRDGTYDCVSITPAMDRPESGKYWSRTDAYLGGDFVNWEEA